MIIAFRFFDAYISTPGLRSTAARDAAEPVPSPIASYPKLRVSGRVELALLWDVDNVGGSPNEQVVVESFLKLTRYWMSRAELRQRVVQAFCKLPCDGAGILFFLSFFLSFFQKTPSHGSTHGLRENLDPPIGIWQRETIGKPVSSAEARGPRLSGQIKPAALFFFFFFFSSHLSKFSVNNLNNIQQKPHDKCMLSTHTHTK